VWGVKEQDEELREWVLEWVVGKWERLKGRGGVKELVREGGEFVVDVMERV
jgi:hypothetical protein